jgi:hypothetical protein
MHAGSAAPAAARAAAARLSARAAPCAAGAPPCAASPASASASATRRRRAAGAPLRATAGLGVRVGHVKRVTKETSVDVMIDLDGTGVCVAESGIPFLDHMLDVRARARRARRAACGAVRSSVCRIHTCAVKPSWRARGRGAPLRRAAPRLQRATQCRAHATPARAAPARSIAPHPPRCARILSL